MPKTSKGALRTLVIDISVDKATQSPLGNCSCIALPPASLQSSSGRGLGEGDLK